jgi:nucleotide-binding universal stress UspA family protein
VGRSRCHPRARSTAHRRGLRSRHRPSGGDGCHSRCCPRMAQPVLDIRERQGQGVLFDYVEIQEATRALVSESLAGARADRPDVEVELIPGQVARAIMPAGESAKSADLVVVGSRGGWRLHQPAPRLRQPERPAPRPLPGRHRSLRTAVYGLSAAVRR